MISKISPTRVDYNNNRKMKPNVTSPVKKSNTAFKGNEIQSPGNLAGLYQSMFGIKKASTLNFMGESEVTLGAAFDELNMEVITCADPNNPEKGEKVGSRENVTELVNKIAPILPEHNNAIKADVVVDEGKEEKTFIKTLGNGRTLEKKTTVPTVTIGRTQIKSLGHDLMYEVAVRQPKPANQINTNLSLPLKQRIGITMTPENYLKETGMLPKDSRKETAYTLNTKGNLMAIVEDYVPEENVGRKRNMAQGSFLERYVLMTDAGTIEKKSPLYGALKVEAEKTGNVFKPFVVEPQPVRERHPEKSIGEGTEIVIGMEEGRFVPEIIDSIAEFEYKIENGEIVLDTFVAAPDAKKTQLAMLAGGFGSRAEYTNASSDGIFHSNDPEKVRSGAQSTKGVFRTPTGLTPMETTFITLHKAGLLDCSKGVFGIGKNVKFYLNKSGVNKGNGGFTLDLYDKMARNGRDSLLILPNDPISRVTNAMKETKRLIDSGEAAMVMIAKEVKPEDAKGFGVMRLGENNEILEFVEKPKVVPDNLKNSKGMCLANTFQFAVSKEAFKAIETLSPYFPVSNGKEPKDWSKCLTPIVMELTKEQDIGTTHENIAKILTGASGVKVDADDIPMEAVETAKEIIGNQKVVAVETDEPWADCGSLNQLYDTTMKIASGNFPLEDFERANVLKCVDTETGLVTTSPELKEAIESKYNVDGQVMATYKARKINPEIVNFYKEAITVNEKEEK